jgi:hypothetical protein
MVKTQKSSEREIEELFKVCKGISTDETSRTMLQTVARLCIEFIAEDINFS